MHAVRTKARHTLFYVLTFAIKMSSAIIEIIFTSSGRKYCPFCYILSLDKGKGGTGRGGEGDVTCRFSCIYFLFYEFTYLCSRLVISKACEFLLFH